MAIKLDKYDKTLLYELDRDSSQELANLAKKLNRSKQFVLYRIKKLEEQKVIIAYNAIVDMSKLGYFTFRVYLDLKETTEEEKNNIINYAKTIENIWTITTMHEKWDLALFLGVKSVNEFHSIFETIFSRYKEKIKKYNVSIYAPIYNLNRRFFLEKNELPITRVYGIGEKEEISELDFNIIKAYAPNVRQSSLELSKKINASPDTIRAHIKNLEKRRVIAGYKIGLNIEALGYQSYRIDFELKSFERIKELFNLCKSLNSIYQINKTIGGADFEVEAVVKSKEELIKLIDNIKIKFKDTISDVDYFGFSTFHILNYIPD